MEGVKKGLKPIVSQRTLSDTRDSNTYVVRKLADGNCWMSQNLRLVGSRTLTSANSDVTSNFTLPASAGGVWASSTPTETEIDTAHVYYANNTTYGAYYNYYTATAGTGTYSKTSGNATSSICPKGWRLLNSTTEHSLWVAYGMASKTIEARNTAMQSFPINYVLAGLYSYNGSLFNSGVEGDYMSSEASEIPKYKGFITWGDSYKTTYSPGWVSDYVRTDGRSVRCIAK